MANKKRYYHKNRSQKPDSAQVSLQQQHVAALSEAQLLMSLADMGVSESTCELLEKNKIVKAADLVRRTEKDMYKVQGLNKRILLEVKDCLKKNGMSLCPEMPKKSVDAQSEQQKQDITQKPADKKKKQQDKKSAQEPIDKEENTDKKSKFGLVDRALQKGNQNANNRQGKQSQQKQQKPEKLTEPLKAGQWRKVLKGGKWGYSDGFKIVIPTQYDEIFAFKEGLASVEINEKCGYINEQNEVVIPLDYDTAMSFSEGLAMVVKGDKCGYINKNNEVIIPFEYDAATPFEEGEAKIKKDGKWGTITTEGKTTWI